MNEIKVLFYKAEGKLIDKLIRWWTSSNYSHCELLVPDGRIYSVDSWEYGEVRYTSRYNIDNWTSIAIPMSDYRLKHLKRWCSDRVGQKYDWMGVVRFVLPFIPQAADKWFCSELCGAALKYVGVLGYHVDIHGMSPQSLYMELTRRKKALSS